MSNVAFNTHSFVKRLTEVGMPEEQAEVLADSYATLIDEKLATKRDLKELALATKRDLKELELRLRHVLTLRLGSMMVAAVGIVAVLTRVL
ncbi:MAG: hypothetical protein OXJ56_07040 [Rhodospirillaceae bacterium]|nr:hypothetical protein [Rhodospirillaceae bacterium]